MFSSSSSSTPLPPPSLSKADVEKIFFCKTVLFIGDSTVRTLYRDVAKLMATGGRLADGDAALQLGESASFFNGERRERQGGHRGNLDYVDFRRYTSPFSSSSLFYVFLATIDGPETANVIEFIRLAQPPIDMIVFSSVLADMSCRQISKSELSFSAQLAMYSTRVEDVCRRFSEASSSSSSRLWLSALSPLFDGSDDQMNQHHQIVMAGNDASIKGGFCHLDDFRQWLTKGGQLLMPKKGHLSSEGVRVLTSFLCRFAAQQWHPSLPLSFSQASSPVVSSSQPVNKHA